MALDVWQDRLAKIIPLLKDLSNQVTDIDMQPQSLQQEQALSVTYNTEDDRWTHLLEVGSSEEKGEKD